MRVRADGVLLTASAEALRVLGLADDEGTNRYTIQFKGEADRRTGSIEPVESYPISRALAAGRMQSGLTIEVRRSKGESSSAVFRAVPVKDTPSSIAEASTVDRLTPQHKGAVVGEGSTFSPYSPLSEVKAPVPRRARSKSPNGKENILVVDDNDAVRRLTVLVLKASGYTVTEAQSGAEALVEFSQPASSIDLVLMDVVMPGVNGPEVARLVRRFRDNLPILFTTGKALDNRPAELSETASVLYKPYKPKDLLRRLREMLNNSRIGARDEIP